VRNILKKIRKYFLRKNNSIAGLTKIIFFSIEGFILFILARKVMPKVLY